MTNPKIFEHTIGINISDLDTVKGGYIMEPGKLQFDLLYPKRTMFFMFVVSRGKTPLGVIRNFGKKIGWAYTPLINSPSLTTKTMCTIFKIMDKPQLCRELCLKRPKEKTSE